jgi:integrase
MLGKMVGGEELRDAMKAAKSKRKKSEKAQQKEAVVTVKEAFEKVLTIKLAQIGKRGQERYRNFLNTWKAWAEPNGTLKKDIKDLDKNDVLSFLDYVQTERGLANRTRNGLLSVCVTFLNELLARNYIEKNPGHGIKKLTESGKRNIPYTREQQTILEDYLKRTDYQLFLYTRFIYYGFLRPVEILRLKVKDVDLQQGIILVRTHVSKNKQQLPVTITESLEPFIREMELEKCSPGMYLFGKNLEPGFDSLLRNRVSERHAKAMKACHVYDGEVTMYSWKHTGNCNAYRAGADIKALQFQNRHSSLEMTDIYLRSLGLTQQYKLRNLKW